jgi:signal transduction histidine kinase
MNIQVDRLTYLVGDLLDVSKIQAGKLELRLESFSLQDIIVETIENVQATTYSHMIILQGEIRSPVYGDRDRIAQVVINLLSNAVKYSPAATKIIVQLEDLKKEVRVSVQDFGIGIPKEHQERIFERFYRVHSKSEHSFSGLGMGLYISSQIIARHKGKMEVHSIEGKGTTFTFTLPK